jgi:putative oxidoreductase
MNSNSGEHGYTFRSIRLWLLVLLWLALAAQMIWIGLQHFRGHRPWSSMWYPIVFIAPCLAVALSGGCVRWIAAILRILIALAFLQAVADRFGLLGPPGTAGVAWGTFARFIHYTGIVNSFLPAALIPAVAVLATIGETVFGLTMLLGIRIRWAAVGSAVLLFLFATAMSISGLSQFSYGVYMICAGAAMLSLIDASFLSLDAAFSSKRTEAIIAGGSGRA